MLARGWCKRNYLNFPYNSEQAKRPRGKADVDEDDELPTTRKKRTSLRNFQESEKVEKSFGAYGERYTEEAKSMRHKAPLTLVGADSPDVAAPVSGTIPRKYAGLDVWDEVIDKVSISYSDRNDLRVQNPKTIEEKSEILLVDITWKDADASKTQLIPTASTTAGMVNLYIRRAEITDAPSILALTRDKDTGEDISQELNARYGDDVNIIKLMFVRLLEFC
ncbi:hypothetical protein HDU96_009503 [Phlyctochytrium bullatum]|nr:hypothetical protein HDU96_009503 [Phlyctochytrium bullatum]